MNKEETRPPVESIDKIKRNAGEKKKPIGRPKGKKDAYKRAPGKPSPPPTPEEAATAEEEKATFLESGSAMVQTALDYMFKGLLAPRLGEHWALSLEEKKAGGEIFAALIYKYAPAVNRFAEEIAAGGWIVQTCGPRYQKTLEIVKEQMEAELREEPLGHEAMDVSVGELSKKEGEA